MCELIIYSNNAVGLDDAIAAFKGKLEGGTALVAGANQYAVGKLVGGKIIFDTEEFDCIFDVRIFTKECELRWVAPGRAALITEEKVKVDGWAPSPHTVEKHDNSYLLWGEGIGGDGVSAARVGAIRLPVEVSANKRACLKTVEYFSNTYPDGNYAVLDERLVGLEVI